jgi:hypothetical protein
MKFDPVLNAYVDIETNAVIFKETEEHSIVPTESSLEPYINPENIVFDEIHSAEGGFILESELNTMRSINGAFDVEPGSMTPEQANDWQFARSLQFLEFEIANEEIDGYDQNDPSEGDFGRREGSASSCKKQLLTASFALCIIQVSEPAIDRCDF